MKQYFTIIYIDGATKEELGVEKCEIPKGHFLYKEE